ncbi:tyrosine-type recombinase/integrase [Sphingorhabdus sp.]|uniref:tyrosine-type recombinase/integrase n=1 Tax=Sphingorhabdus sp. TaxID=1902408 RepID=UPI0035B44FE2
MPKAKLDFTFCLTARCKEGKGKTDFWDTIIQGFVLEVRSTGGKTYYLRYFDQSGRQRQHKLGRYQDISFDQARKLAKRLRAEVVMGGDPAAKKAEKKAIPTYAALAAQHLEHARSYQKSPDNTQSVLQCHLLPRWGKLRLDEIKPQEVAKWLAEKHRDGLAHATVDKIRVIFNRSFELGRQWNIPGCDNNPVRLVPRRRYSNARERYLTTDEAQRLFKALDKSDNPQIKSIVSLLLLTGARKNELLKAEWRHVSLDRKAWLIPTSKTGKSRYVPISQDAIAIMEQLPRWDGCPWLIPNPDTRKPYNTIKRAWDTARCEAGLPDLRLHDLRHSAASFMINAGIDLYAVGRILGHADHQSTMRYSHLANDTLLAAVEAGAARLKGDWLTASR